MKDAELPRIVSPNLGCPLILSADNPQIEQPYLVLADRKGNHDWSGYQLKAVPSYSDDGIDCPVDFLGPYVIAGSDMQIGQVHEVHLRGSRTQAERVMSPAYFFLISEQNQVI